MQNLVDSHPKGVETVTAMKVVGDFRILMFMVLEYYVQAGSYMCDGQMSTSIWSHSVFSIEPSVAISLQQDPDHPQGKLGKNLGIDGCPATTLMLLQ